MIELPADAIAWLERNPDHGDAVLDHIAAAEARISELEWAVWWGCPLGCTHEGEGDRWSNSAYHKFMAIKEGVGEVEHE